MKKLLVASVILFSLTFSALALYQSDFQDFTGVQEFNYETFRQKTGELLFTEKFTISKEKFKGNDFLVVKSESLAQEETQDQFDKKTITYYSIKNNLLSTYYHENNTTKNDQPFLSFKIDFDWQNRKAHYSLNEFEKEKNRSKALKLSKNTMPTHDLGIFFQNMIINQQKEEPFTVIFPNGNKLNLRAKVKGQEKIKTKAGEFDCQRIEMKPDFNLISFFAPSINFWLMSQPPYSYIRYEGPERGLNSPRVVQELVSTNKL